MSLPDYVLTDDPVLHQPSRLFTFPLSKEDKHDLQILKSKFLEEENAAGLAAPQIDIGKAAIIFAADNLEIKKFRKDFEQTMPQTLWLNPRYKAKEDDTTNDWEACFSIRGMAYLVPRFNSIIYEAYDMDGQRQTGTATGFLARLIQHEIDHTMGVLCSDRAIEQMDMEEYREKRRKAMERGKEASSAR